MTTNLTIQVSVKTDAISFCRYQHISALKINLFNILDVFNNRYIFVTS